MIAQRQYEHWMLCTLLCILLVALAACERIVEVAENKYSPLDLGYYLWLHGKEPAIRGFARHHTKDTVYY